VTLTQAGVVPYPRGYDFPDGFQLLFCDIMIDAEELLRVCPADESVENAPKLPVAERRPLRSSPVGRPPHEARDAFIREMIRLADSKDGLPEKSELNRLMKIWAAQEYEHDVPGDTTIGDWLATCDYRRPPPAKKRPSPAKARKAPRR
jgi:hypothetical protein